MQRDNTAGRLFLAAVPCLYKGDNSTFLPHEGFAEDKSIKDALLIGAVQVAEVSCLGKGLWLRNQKIVLFIACQLCLAPGNQIELLKFIFA